MRANAPGAGRRAAGDATDPCAVARTLQNTLLALASIAFTVSLMECGLRLRDYGSIVRVSGEHVLRFPDPVRGWILLPGRTAFQRTRDYGITVTINDKGLRDRPHEYTPAPGVFRIVVLGDSFMEAYQVTLEESLPHRLQERLAARGVEVVNLGVGGYGTIHAYLALREEGLRYQPDLVILAFFSNDVSDDSRALQELRLGPDDLKTFGRPFVRIAGDDAEIEWVMPDPDRVERYVAKRRAKRSGALRAVLRFLEPTQVGNAFERGLSALLPRAVKHHDPHVILGWPFLSDFSPEFASPKLDRSRYDEVWEDAWRITRRMILETQRLARSAGAEFVILYVPTPVQVDPEYRRRVEREFPGLPFDHTRLNRELARFSAEHGIPLFDPLDAFIAENSQRLLFHQFEDRHWNADGHEVATRELVRFLDREALIPPGARGGPSPGEL